MSQSIMQTNKECYLCGRKTNLEKHHVMAGTANRKLSEQYGVWCWLCHDCHTGTEGAQYDKQKNWDLKRDAQIAFEELYGRKKWMEVFRKSYVW